MREERVFIPSSGIRLEGLLSVQEALLVDRGLLCCHPHPLYGGEMHNPVVSAAVETGIQEGYTTLRFNFRGAGQSEGAYGDGPGEKEDVAAALGFLASRLKGPEASLVLMGYSFGAWVGLPVGAGDERVRAVAAVAPPLEMYDFAFLEDCPKPKMIIAGSRDLFCPPSKLETWYQRLREPKSMTILQGADHFLFSHRQALMDAFREFLRGLPFAGTGVKSSRG